MTPTSRVPLLLCSKCGRKGFLREKKEKLRIPQYNKIKNLNDGLEYLYKILYKDLKENLMNSGAINGEIKFEMKLSDYRVFVPFSPHNDEELKKFEIRVITSFIRHSFNIEYSKDLEYASSISSELNELNSSNAKTDLTDKDNVVFLSRFRLILIYRILSLISLKKCVDYLGLEVHESYNKEFTETIKNFCYEKTFHIDKNRIKIDYNTYLNLHDDQQKISLNYALSKNVKRDRFRCSSCKTIVTLEQFSNKPRCIKCNEKLQKVMPSIEYLRKKFLSFEEIISNSNRSFLELYCFLLFVKDEWFQVNSMNNDFRDYFTEIEKEFLERLEVSGKSYYMMAHYNSKNNKSECHLSREQDFLDLKLVFHEYREAFENIIKIQKYGKSGEIYSSTLYIWGALINLKFPAKYIPNKIKKDYEFFAFRYWDKIRISVACKLIASLRSLASEEHTPQSSHKALEEVTNLFENITKKGILDYVSENCNNDVVDIFDDKIYDLVKNDTNFIESINYLFNSFQRLSNSLLK